jgi:isoquinoline 1-oxidoreductase subunit beta
MSIFDSGLGTRGSGLGGRRSELVARDSEVGVKDSAIAGRVERRTFIKATAAAAGGLLLGFYIPEGSGEAIVEAQFGPPAAGGALNPNAFIRIGADDIVTLIIHKPDNGQGTETSIAMLLAEELECDWSKVRTEFAPINPVYGGALQGTFGSLAIRTSYEPMRRAGAAAREMLVEAAALGWGIEKAQCRAENSVVINLATSARLSYGSLAAAAAALAVPTTVTLKDAAQFRLIGKPTKRLDAPAKVSGQATFGIDVRLPGMVHAVVARCPVFGGTVARFDATKAKAVAGVTDVVQIPQGVAVVAANTWAAFEGRRALQVEWDEGPNASLNSADIRELFTGLTLKPGAVARHDGDAEAALANASRRVDALYEAPYLAHARLEPYACVAHVSAGAPSVEPASRQSTCEVWTGTQIPGQAHSTAVKASGLTPENVKVHTTYMGGSFGSRGGGAFVAEAVEIAKRVGVPVKLTYSRDDELQHDLYRPASCVRFAAGLDAEGWPSAWSARIACPTWLGLRNGVARESVEGIAEYDVPNVHVEYHDPGIGIPTGYWRSVGLSQNAFFAESFLDELAAVTGKDPLEFRRRLVKSPRLLAVLNAAAERAGWGRALPAGRFRGLAAVAGFGSFNAQVAEISVSQGTVRVHRVVCVVDCGRVVNPAGVIQQMQGGLVYGLSAALRGNITIARGRVEQQNFHQYEPLRMHEMPVVEVHIMPSQAPPGGIGEVATPAIAPAVANAIFSATGKRIRRLPFSLESLT